AELELGERELQLRDLGALLGDLRRRCCCTAFGAGRVEHGLLRLLRRDDGDPLTVHFDGLVSPRCLGARSHNVRAGRGRRAVGAVELCYGHRKIVPALARIETREAIPFTHVLTDSHRDVDESAIHTRGDIRHLRGEEYADERACRLCCGWRWRWRWCLGWRIGVSGAHPSG